MLCGRSKLFSPVYHLTSHSLSQGLEKGSGDMASAIPSVLVLPPCPKVRSIGN